MVSFRKMSMAFAGCLLTGIGIANAQTPIECKMTAAQPTLKKEGLAEQMGKISLACATTPAATVPTATPNILITFNVALNDGATFTNNFVKAADRTMDGPTIKVGGVQLEDTAGNPIVAKLSSDGKTATFPLTVIDAFREAAPAAQETATVEIDGLVINAHGATSTVPTATVTAFSFQNGNGNKTATVVDGTKAIAQIVSAISFTGVASAAKLDCAEYKPAAADQVPGGLAQVVFEPGYPGALENALLTARFTVPSGASLYVGTSNVTKAGAWQAVVAGTPYALHAAAAGSTFVQVKANDDGIYEYTWKVSDVGDGMSAFYFPVYITVSENFTPGSTLTAIGGLGPFSTDDKAIEDGDVPRFVTPTVVSDPLVTVTSCNTTLIFPYATNVGNWDTGIAITNPTADMKGVDGKWAAGGKDAKKGQNGACTLYYVGTNAPEKAVQTKSVDAGKTLVFMVGTGNGDDVAGVPGFNGYLKVSCDFKFGRGFAFMSSSDLGGVGVGYVASDIPAVEGLVP